MWEKNTLSLLKSKVGKDYTVVDIGSWIWPVSLYVSTILDANWRCYSLEPDSVAYAMLSRNYNANPDLKWKMDINPFWIWDSTGTKHIGVWPNKFSWLVWKNTQGDSTSFVTDRWGSQEIKTMTLTDFVIDKKISKIDFIKMDIEWWETRVFPTVLDTMKRMGQNKPKILIEVHPYAFNEEQKWTFINTILSHYRTILWINPSEPKWINQQELIALFSLSKKPFNLFLE